MDAAPLKSFATSARTELIREVGARITAVLAQGSPERVEQPRAVAALERAIAAGGGGNEGKAHLADKVAYTWFNRIVALRFMDVNGHTGIGVVSPAADQVGQPEVLATAKRGQVDAKVVKGPNAAAIPALLNGTRQPRPGVDAQAEAYALLLADYCRYWNRAMPFMFEREGDYTELLIPANLLAEDSVLSRSVKVLTEDVCQDVEVIGWLYQFYISERKGEVFAGFKKNKKAGADEIPAATQLFTPHWIVRYLVENSLGRLWMLNHPESRLVDQMKYYIAPVEKETDFLNVAKPEELTVIDPACGSGHMLTYAFDLLYAIYEEEGYTPSQIPALILENNLYGTEIDPRAGALAAFALTMKAAAKRKLFLNNSVQPNICVLDTISFRADELSYLVTKDGDRHAEEAFWNQFAEADTFGALIQPDPALTVRLADHLAMLDDEGDILRGDALNRAQRAIEQATYLTRSYAVVVANPPYMGSKQMNALLSQFMKDEYPDAKSDLFAGFIERCTNLAGTRGAVAMITMQSWMFLSSYEKLRASLLSNQRITSMLHLGARAFDSIGGEVVSATAFVLANVPPESRGSARKRDGTFIRLVDGTSEAEKIVALSTALEVRAKDAGFHLASDADFMAIPGSPIVYWLSEKMRAAFDFGRPMSEIGAPKAGMHGGDVNRFARLWFEVSEQRSIRDAGSTPEVHASRRRWVGLNKGGSFRKWYGNQEYVLAFDQENYDILRVSGNKLPSRDFYFLPQVSWSKVSSDSPAFRMYPQGFVFDVSGTPVFGSESDLLDICAIANSETARRLLEAMAPTLNYEIGQVATLPIVSTSAVDPGHARTKQLISESVADWDSTETSWNFEGNPLAKLAAGGSQLKTLEETVAQHRDEWAARSLAQQQLEIANNEAVANLYGLEDEVPSYVSLERVSLTNNSAFRWPNKTPKERDTLFTQSAIVDLISYAVGCMFGRYSPDEPGLILGDQGSTLDDYLARVPYPTFMPDQDNVIPIVDGDWFEDDIVGRFRHFLRVTFGDKNFAENLNFVTASLGVKDLREYFITKAGRSKFYDDHVQRYKKRPIYWLFSSPKGSFNALIYLHRYTPPTSSTVLTYLREYVTKLESSLQHAERAGNAKDADRLRKILVELNEYEHDTLYPKASENVVIDLDDGVRVNYPKLGGALRKIVGLDSSGD